MLSPSKKEPWFAAFLSFLIPGAGAYYAGKRGLGISFCLCVLTSLVVGVYHVISPNGNTRVGWGLIAVFAVLWLFGLPLSFFIARSVGQLLPRKRDPFLAMFLSAIIPGSGHLYGRKFGQGLFFLIGMILLKTSLSSVVPWYGYDLFIGLCSFHAFAAVSGKRKEMKAHALFAASSLTIIAILCGLVYFFITENVSASAVSTGPSMKPTIQPGDVTLWMRNAIPNLRRGDIVVFEGYPQYADRLIHKKLIAVPGEKVEMSDSGITINGEVLRGGSFDTVRFDGDTSWHYVTPGNPYLVPEGSFFVLGDNLLHSIDSRQIGAIGIERLVGIEYKIIWPWDRISMLREP